MGEKDMGIQVEIEKTMAGSVNGSAAPHGKKKWTRLGKADRMMVYQIMQEGETPVEEVAKAFGISESCAYAIRREEYKKVCRRTARAREAKAEKRNPAAGAPGKTFRDAYVDALESVARAYGVDPEQIKVEIAMRPEFAGKVRVKVEIDE